MKFRIAHEPHVTPKEEFNFNYSYNTVRKSDGKEQSISVDQFQQAQSSVFISPQQYAAGDFIGGNDGVYGDFSGVPDNIGDLLKYLDDVKHNIEVMQQKNGGAKVGEVKQESDKAPAQGGEPPAQGGEPKGEQQ
ncbi:hypothetical protein [Flyfo microvirus Tbat2_158]|nr:hypothetical protein [Flyfo microvirus Tbat2_158]